MEYRAIIQYVDNWWIGWLIDLPGVNAQEKTREKLLESLRIGAEDLINIPPEIPDGAELVRITI